MSRIYAETIDSSDFVSSVIFTSSVFTSLPLFVPWVQPQPNRKYRISYSGDSSSFIGSIVCYWRPESAIVTISNYTGPSNKYNPGGFYVFNVENYYGPPYSMFF